MEAGHAARKAPTVETEAEQYEEYECEDDYKEPKPEELSLLGDQVSQSFRHLSVGKTDKIKYNCEGFTNLYF